MLAPVVIFAYNRLDHLQKTIEALQKNILAPDTEVYIYSDAPKTESVREQVQKVREYLDTLSGFKNITIIKREKNYGLSANIVDGVTNIINEYGKVIVIEDDIVTSPHFLSYMNQALEYFQNELRVWHISGYCYPVDLSDVGDTFFLHLMDCWGWGTWFDRWKFFEKDLQKILRLPRKEKKHFDLNGTGIFWDQVLLNYFNIIHNWDIYWYATIYLHKGLCLHPSLSYVQNIGHDNSGVHCSSTNVFLVDRLNMSPNVSYPNEIEENPIAFERISNFLKQNRTPFVKKLQKLVLILRKKFFKF